jgi:hypothetical protein
MSPAKKKSTPAAPSKFAPFVATLAGGGKYLLLGVILVGAMIFAGVKIRDSVRSRAASSAEYQLTPENIQISPWPMPVYVQPDPRLDAFDQLRRHGPVSIMDDNLAERITAAFEQNPWVAKVHKASKEYPGTVKVELEFRRPVLMVLIENQFDKTIFDSYAVDAEGVSLPTAGCFTANETALYPKLTGVDAPPTTGLGKRWADSRVVGAAEMAAALLSDWEKMRLKRIVPRPVAANVPAASTQSPRFAEYYFEIAFLGENGKENEKRIFWGRSPGIGSADARTPEQKIKKLEAIFAEAGSLDKYPKEIDLTKP